MGMEASALSWDVVSYALDNIAANDDSQALFIDAQKPDRALNATQTRWLVRTLVVGLSNHGVQSGDCVLVHMGNNVLYTALVLSIIGTGGVYMGSNPLSQPDELNHILRISSPKVIITEPSALPTVLSTALENGVQKQNILVLDDDAIDYIVRLLATPDTALPTEEPQGQFSRLLSHGQSQWKTIPDKTSSESTPAAMFLTSGTSGLPKAAVLSHGAIIAQHQGIAMPAPYTVRRIIALPMYHLFGALWAHIFPIRYGQPLYVLPQFTSSQFLEAVHRYQISETYLVPTMVHIINQAPSSFQDSLRSLRFVGVAGAPIDRCSLQRFQDALHPDGCVSQLWGMTEVGVAFHNRPRLRREQQDLDSIGCLSPGYEALLVNEDTTQVDGDGCTGQLYVRGEGLFMAYHDHSTGKDENGWFCTGDIAYRSGSLYFIVGRKKELIKVRGLQVAPAEIEATLLKHPQITDVAVIGVTLPDGSTEAPRAYVVRADGPASTLTKDEVYSFVQSRLASYKTLDGGIFYVDQIPRTTTGKILRGKLTQMDSRRDRMAKLLARFKTNAPAASPQ